MDQCTVSKGSLPLGPDANGGVFTSQGELQTLLSILQQQTTPNENCEEQSQGIASTTQKKIVSISPVSTSQNVSQSAKTFKPILPAHQPTAQILGDGNVAVQNHLLTNLNDFYNIIPQDTREVEENSGDIGIETFLAGVLENTKQINKSHSEDKSKINEEEMNFSEFDEDFLRRFTEDAFNTLETNKQEEQQRTVINDKKIVINVTGEQPPVYTLQNNVPQTPDILEDILSYESKYLETSNGSKLLSSASQFRAPFCSPTKSESANSDSGYESAHSPSSVNSESPSHFDCSPLDDLFPFLT